jgi:fibronectin type 3 domain-containing protein
MKKIIFSKFVYPLVLFSFIASFFFVKEKIFAQADDFASTGRATIENSVLETISAPPLLTLVSGSNRITSEPGSEVFLKLEVSAWSGIYFEPLGEIPVTFSVLAGGGLLSEYQGGPLSESITVYSGNDGSVNAYYAQPEEEGHVSVIRASIDESDPVDIEIRTSGSIQTPFFLRRSAMSASSAPLPALDKIHVWLRADQGIVENEGYISLWGDQSGNNRNAVQLYSYYPSPFWMTNVLNGNPVVSFTYADSEDLYFGEILSGKSEGEIFAVLKAKGVNSGQDHYLWNLGNVPTYYPDRNGKIREGFFSSQEKQIGVPPIDISQWHIYNLSSKKGLFDARFNGQLYFRADNTTRSYGNKLGGGFDGDIAEIIIYEKILTDEERDAVGRYLTDKYGFMNLPDVPEGLTVKAIGGTQALISWSRKPDVRYVIERKGSSGTYEFVAEAEGASYIDSGLDVGQIYTYRLKSRNYAGDSAAGEEKAVMLGYDESAMPMDSISLWLRADSAALGSLSYWNNQGPDKGVFARSMSSIPPEVIADEAGFQAVHLDVTKNQYLSVKNVLQNKTASEVFVVLKAKNNFPSSGHGLWGFGGSENNYPNYDGKIKESFGLSGAQNFSVGGIDLCGWNIYNVSAKSGLWEARMNGELLHQLSGYAFYPSNNATVTLGMSSMKYFDGYIAEILVYERTLSAAERAGVGSYLTVKYLTGSIPVPEKPSSVTAKPVGNQVYLSWIGGGSNESYIIERRLGNGSYEVIASVEGRTSFVDENLVAGNYTYRVRASNYAGDSEYSDLLTVAVSGENLIAKDELVLWLRADTESPGVSSLWSDYSGKGNHARQMLPSSRPEIVAGVVNGFPAARFNGSSYFSLSNVLNGSTEAEVFIALKANQKSGSNRGLWTWGRYGTYYPASNGSITEGFSLNSQQDLGTPMVDIDRWHLYNISAKAGEWEARQNGLSFYRNTNPTLYFNMSELGAYSTTRFDGDIAEVLVYKRVLSPQERASIGRYLSQKYEFESMSVAQKPSGFVAKTLLEGEVILSWNPQDGMCYIVERKSGSGEYETIADLERQSYFVDKNVTGGTTYQYRVQASNYRGESAYSDVVTATLAGLPALPQGELALWLRADMESPGRLGVWRDQSGNVRNVTQNTNTAKPELQNGSMDAFPFVKFNETQYFSVPKLTGTVYDVTVFAVLRAKTAAPTKNRILWKLGNGETHYPNTSGLIYDYTGSTSSKNVTPTVNLEDWNVYSVCSQQNRWEAYLNGESVHQTSSNAAYVQSSSYLGYYTANSFEGDIAEIIIYNRALSENEHFAVGQYLSQKYDLPFVETVSVPSGLNTNLGHREVTLNWSGGSNPAGAKYVIERREQGGEWEKIAEVTGLAYTDESVLSGKDYEYRIHSVVNGVESDYSDIIAVSTPGLAPKSPENLVSGFADGIVSLSWTDGRNDNDVQYIVERRKAGEAWEQLAITQDLFYNDSAIRPEESYEYRISAFVEEFHSGASDVLAVTIPEMMVPWTPKHLSVLLGAADSYSNRVTLSWQPLEGFEGYYIVERNRNVSSNPAENVWETVSYQSWVGYADLCDSTLPFYRVTAVNEYGQSEPSAVVESIRINDVPEHLKAVVLSRDSVKLSWSSASPVSIERRANGGAWEEIVTVASAPQQGYTDKGLLVGVNYEYRACMVANPWPAEYTNTAAITIRELENVNKFAVPLDGMRLWLQGDRGVSTYLENGVQFVKWADQSGVNFHVISGTGGVAPLSSSGGNAGVSFSQSAGQKAMLFPSTVFAGANNFDVFVVSKRSNNGKLLGLLGGMVKQNVDTDEPYTFFVGDLPVGFPHDMPRGRDTHIYNLSKNAESAAVRVDGLVLREERAAVFEGLFSGDIYLGDAFDGYVQEIIVFDRSLGGDERKAVESYLRKKYGLYTYTGVSVLKPTDLRSFSVSKTQLHLAWNGSLDEGAAYVIERSIDGTNYAKVAEVAGLSYIDSSLEPGRTYFYRIYGKGGYETSETSDALEAKTDSEINTELPLSALRAWFKADTGSARYVVHSWKSQAGFASGVWEGIRHVWTGVCEETLHDTFERYSYTFGPLHLSDELHAGISSGELVSVMRQGAFGIRIGGHDFVGEDDFRLGHNDYKMIGTMFTPAKQEYYENGLKTGERNEGIVLAKEPGSLGYGSYASEIMFFERPLTEAERAVVSVYLGKRYRLDIGKLPERPYDLESETINASQVVLNWSGNHGSTHGIRYVIERRKENGDWEFVGETTNFTYIDSDLDAETEYAYRVRAVGFAGSSDFSFETTVMTAKTSEDLSPIPFDALRLWLKGANNPVAAVADLSGLNYAVQGKSAWDERLNAWAMTKAEVVNGGSIMAGQSEGELFMVMPSENYSPTSFNFGQSSDSRIYSHVDSSDYERYIAFTESFGRGMSAATFELLQSHTPAGPMLYNVSADASQWKARVNGREVKALAAASSPRFTSNNRIFAEVENGVMEGEWSTRFSEVMLFERVLTEGERESVNRYLSAKNPMGIVAKLQNLEEFTASYADGAATLRWRGGNASYYTIERGIRDSITGEINWYKIATLRGGVDFYVDDDSYFYGGCFYRITVHDNYGNTVSEVLERPAFADDVGEIGNDVLLWLKADEGVQHDAQNRVSHWLNTVSGRSGLHQKSYQLMPALVENAVNGKPAIRFDGSMAWMNVPAFDDDDMRIEVIAVAREQGDIEKDTTLMVYRMNLLHEEYPNGLGRLIGNGFKIYDNTTPKFFSNNLADYKTKDTLGLGFKGDIAELIIYKRDSLSSSQRAQIIRNLEQKYALPNRAQGAQVADNGSHRLVIKPDGTLWANGNNAYGQLGNGQRINTQQIHYTRVGNLTNVIAVATGATYSLALTANGNLYAFGSFNYDGAGQYYTVYSNPQLIASGVYAISDQMYCSSAGIYWWQSSEWDKRSRAPVNGAVKQIASSNTNYMVLFSNGSIFCWSPWNRPELGAGAQIHPNFAENQTIYSATISLGVVKKIDTYGGSAVALMEDGSVYVWGNGTSSTPAQILLSGVAQDIRADGTRTRVLFEDGHCQKIDGLGNLNNQYAGRHDSPTQICAISRNLMIRKDGAVLSNFGDNAECIIASAEDSDNDGLPDYWENYYFGNLTTVSGIDDTDGDGRKNFEEYYRRTNPKEADNHPWPGNNWERNNAWKKNVYLRPLFDRYNPASFNAFPVLGNTTHYRNNTFHFWVNNDLDNAAVHNADKGSADWKVWKEGDIPNCDDDVINGEKDITDFFPVWIDLTTFFDRVNSLGYLPEDWNELAIFFLHEDEAVNVLPAFFENNPLPHVGQLPHVSLSKIDELIEQKVFPTYSSFDKFDFEEERAFTIVKGIAGYGYTAGSTMHVGFDYWKDLDQNYDKFGVMIEGKKETSKPLIMEIRTRSGKLLYRSEFPLSISEVTSMYRHENLVEVVEAEDGVPKCEILPGYESRPEAPNFPDIYNDAKNFVFVHGYNVNQYEAEGGHNELFKNLFWTKSKMKFHGVTWYGNEPMIGDMESTVQMNYQHDVRNAFLTAPALAEYLDRISLSRDKLIVGGHSLGNMLVSAAIQDWGANPDVYFMFDAAVTKEAYDPKEKDLTDGHTTTPPANIGMEHISWRGYDRKLWSANWYQHWKEFGQGEFRSHLTWTGRFADVPKDRGFYNYYSSGEDVLMKPSDDSALIHVMDEPWRAQEQLKGMGPITKGLGNTGGWSKNNFDWVAKRNGMTYDYIGLGQLPKEEANTYADNSAFLRKTPFFIRDNDRLHQEGQGGSEYAKANEYRLLAHFLPAQAWAAGGNPFTRTDVLWNASIDMNGAKIQLRENREDPETGEIIKDENEEPAEFPVWPLVRLTDWKLKDRWTHSDLKNMAYPYIYRLYESILENEKKH